MDRVGQLGILYSLYTVENRRVWLKWNGNDLAVVRKSLRYISLDQIFLFLKRGNLDDWAHRRLQVKFSGHECFAIRP